MSVRNLSALVLAIICYTFNTHAQVAVSENYHSNGNRQSVTFDKGSNGIQLISFYESGKIREVGHIKEGRPHGEWRSWNEQGIRTGIAYYVRGRKTGNWKIYNNEGELRYELTYRNGELITRKER